MDTFFFIRRSLVVVSRSVGRVFLNWIRYNLTQGKRFYYYKINFNSCIYISIHTWTILRRIYIIQYVKYARHTCRIRWQKQPRSLYFILLFFCLRTRILSERFSLLLFFILPCLIFPMDVLLFIPTDNITPCKWRVNMAGGRCSCCLARGKEEIFKLKKKKKMQNEAMHWLCGIFEEKKKYISIMGLRTSIQIQFISITERRRWRRRTKLLLLTLHKY